jgi:hypothetical protein
MEEVENTVEDFPEEEDEEVPGMVDAIIKFSRKYEISHN